MAHILVIDDDLVSLKFTSFALEHAGHHVLSATNGPQGLAMARTHMPDLVLLDVIMPGMDGFATVRMLRADPETTWLRVIALSALNLQHDRTKLLAAGFDDFYEKPVEYKKLLADIECLLNADRRCVR